MKRWLCILCAAVCAVWLVPGAAARVPYDSYTYDYQENVAFTPHAYIPDGTVSGDALGIGAFSSPQDICVAPDGLVYLADTGNNRIVVLNAEMDAVVEIIDGFESEQGREGLLKPNGVAVSDDNEVYIADSEHFRVVVLKDGKLKKIIQNPQSEMLDAGFVFIPLKLAVDYAGRVYCVARGMFQGIMVFDSEGAFIGFFGTIKVSITVWEKFWRRFSTKEERSRQLLFIPTEFTGVDVDKSGFVYASNIDANGEQAVRRLNPRGEDVINKGENDNLGGDLWIGGTGTYAGPSFIVDVAVRDKGVYSLLDSRRGRIFTYDHEGNLLYVFGGLGSEAGTFRTPVALEAAGDRLMALDSYRNEVILFAATKYGRLINEAVGLRYDGDEAQAVEKWREVLKLNENLELANTGIGKAYLTTGDNETAMHYLRLGMNRAYYSIAFKRYRNEILKQNLSVILSVLAVAIVGAVLARTLVKRRRRRTDASKV